MKELKRLKSNKAIGLDGISARLKKDSAIVIYKSLTTLYNRSLENGFYPAIWKNGKVVALFKSGDKMDCNNYRPITILPTMRPSKGVTQVACHSFCSCFVSCFIVVNVAVTFNPQHKSQFVAFFQSEVVVCRYFLDSLSPLFKECRLLVITPWWASTMSKILERAVHRQLYDYMIEHNILSSKWSDPSSTGLI